MTSSRRIAHLDMDAFFASVELLHYPELRGQAVVVGGRSARVAAKAATAGEAGARFPRLREYVGRGVVTTSTYEARALGVFSGMGLMQSARLAPDAILLPANFDAYREYSRRFKAAVAAIAPRIEDRGIDEIYIDLSDIDEASEPLARRIKDAVFAATGLHCSIGISPNKLLAKIASDLDKPDGLTLLGREDVPTRLWPLPARKINGIGPKASEVLARNGINTIGELAAAPRELLLRLFGSATAAWMNRVAHGEDERPLVTASVPKSLSRETTFERDLHARQDREQLSEIFTKLCTRVAADLERKGYAGRTIGIKLKYADFSSVTRDLTLPVAVADAGAIRKAAGECLKRVPLSKKIRLLGVRVSGLVAPQQQAPEASGVQGELPF
ncbi:DNA polymerase Y family protein [Rhodocyclus purpureus]|uniref:DNA polymerase Y family protein n=1 Tax=Rhodocyclus purpureus TaxID=1067 RepID=UPI0019117186|nr:DNA polymerase IV [Rhodocyclus purpureus]MBK5915532.1 DNA polymerase IV [Rhodocyclus purpureus]